MTDETLLEEMGLTPTEARVYLVLLEIGQTKSGELIRSAKLQSSTVYHTLSSLLEKGLVSYIMKGKIKYFQAEPPEAFLSFLDEKRGKFEEALPALKKRQNVGVRKRSAKVYEGIKGLKSAYEDVLATMKKGEEYFFLQLTPTWLKNEKAQRFLRSYHLKRSAKGVRVRGLALPQAKKTMAGIYDLPHTRVRYLDELLPMAGVVYKNKVMVQDFEDEPVAFVIESQSVADLYRKFFEEKWKKAKP